MYYYTAFEKLTAQPFSARKKIGGKLQNVLCDDNIYTLDTETSSLFQFPDRVEAFDARHKPKYYRAAIPVGYLYIWQLCINGTVYYGRTGAELLDFLTILHKQVHIRIICYIHNLSFDFEFIRNYITDFEVFARSPRQPLTAYSPKYNIEFRDSLALTNCKLEKLPEVFQLPVEKQVGDLDYHKIRNTHTPMTKKELKYCEYDCLVLYHLIHKFKVLYGHIASIPLTQTGIVRKECQAIYVKDSEYHRHIKAIYPKIHTDFYWLRRAFMGGYVHANYLHAGRILEDVHSYDFASSYPTVMLSEKYPQTAFLPSNVRKFEDMLEDDYCYLLDISFENLNSKCYNHYISKSKCYDLYHAYVDNGRIVSADKCRLYITNIDLQIIRRAYKFSGYTINKAKRSRLGYLDREFMLKILELYGKKTSYKGIDEKYLEYALAKQKLNSMYGMSVTNLIKDLVEFKDNKWQEVVALTDHDVTQKLQEIAKSYSTFLSPYYGVWVTAYARKNLWCGAIFPIDEDVVYCDTDSVKFIGDHTDVIERYNKQIIKKLRDSMKINDIDVALLEPEDPSGEKHMIGVFENDGNYKQFKTLGAKKYCYVDQKNNLHLTLSGVNSKAGVKALGSIENFENGFLFDYKGSGKQLISYNDVQPPTIIKDYLGNVEERSERFGVCLRPNVYRLGVDAEYQEYYSRTPNFSVRCSNVETTDTI